MCGGRKGRRSVLAHRRRKRPRSSLVQVSMRASSGGVYGSAGWCWICGRTGGIPSRRAICVERIMLMQWVVLTGASITQCRRRERRFSGREGGAVFVVTSQRVWREQWAGVKLGSAATQRHSDSTRNRFFCCLRCHCSSYHHRARFSSTLPYLKHQSAGPGNNKSKRKSSGANGEPAVPCALTSWRVFHVAAVHPRRSAGAADTTAAAFLTDKHRFFRLDCLSKDVHAINFICSCALKSHNTTSRAARQLSHSRGRQLPVHSVSREDSCILQQTAPPRSLRVPFPSNFALLHNNPRLARNKDLARDPITEQPQESSDDGRRGCPAILRREPELCAQRKK